MEPPCTFRNAQADDIDRLIEIHFASFPDPRGVEPRRRNFLSNVLGSLDDLHVALSGDVLVGHAFILPLEVWFGGRGVRAAGIASVGVAPEARGQRVAAALLAHLHDQASARGDAIALLFPFRQAFYAKHGYASVSSSRRFDVSPRAIPRAWFAPSSERGIRVRAAMGTDREAIMDAYARAAARNTGWITRPALMWDAALIAERRQWLVAEREGAVVGFTSWTLAQDEAHKPIQLCVHEIVADDDAARRALFGVMGAQRDQITEITLDLAADDPIDRALLDTDAAHEGSSDLEHPLGVIVGGPMVRILDVPRAFIARGYLADGALDIAVAGESSVHLEVCSNVARVTPARGGPSIALERSVLGAILYGTLRPSDALRLGRLVADDPRTVLHADALFALPPYFAIDPF